MAFLTVLNSTMKLRFKTPEEAFDSAYINLCTLNLNEEQLISTSAGYSFEYAMEVLKSRFELGEKAIATDAQCSRNYAIHVLHSRFKLGEKTIGNSPIHTFYYVRYFFANGLIPLDFLELCSVGALKGILHETKNREDLIKVLFKKKILGDK